MDDPVIAREDPGEADIVGLLEAHLSLMRSVSPPGHVHALDLDGLRHPSIRFFTARRHGHLLGVGALRDLGDRHGEIKSMHTAFSARGQGIGALLLDHIVQRGRSAGMGNLSLETGTMEAFVPARTMYEQFGFEVCEPFGDYTANEFSVCMTMELD